MICARLNPCLDLDNSCLVLLIQFSALVKNAGGPSKVDSRFLPLWNGFFTTLPLVTTLSFDNYLFFGYLFCSNLDMISNYHWEFGVESETQSYSVDFLNQWERSCFKVLDVMSILQWEEQIGVRNMAWVTIQHANLSLFLVTFTFHKKLTIKGFFHAVDLYLLSCSLVTVKVGFG